MSERGRLFVISGPSGSGKSTIISRVLHRGDLDFSVSVTTRHPRPGEIDGVHYRFVDRKGFEEMVAAGDLLEWAEFNGNLYGTPAAPIEEANQRGRDVLLDIEVDGARQVKAIRGDAVTIFITTPTLGVLEARLRSSGDTSESDIADRLEIAAEQLAIAHDLFDHVVVNDDLDQAVEVVTELVSRPG